MKNYSNLKDNIIGKINEYKNHKIIAVGATAKGNTFLNYCGIDNNLVDYVTDKSIYKLIKYTPDSRIKIVDDNILSKIINPLVIILSWNISHILKPKLLKLNQNIIFLDIENYL